MLCYYLYYIAYSMYCYNTNMLFYGPNVINTLKTKEPHNYACCGNVFFQCLRNVEEMFSRYHKQSDIFVSIVDYTPICCPSEGLLASTILWSSSSFAYST